MLTYAKIQIWKQFTTHIGRYHLHGWLCLPMQRYKFESNSQLEFLSGSMPWCCAYLCKDTNLKAIHNHQNILTIMMWLCLPMQRYKFESNSQLIILFFLLIVVVLTYAKIQIWKQFTTMSSSDSNVPLLCLPMQRYKFESNSQLSRTQKR